MDWLKIWAYMFGGLALIFRFGGGHIPESVHSAVAFAWFVSMIGLAVVLLGNLIKFVRGYKRRRLRDAGGEGI